MSATFIIQCWGCSKLESRTYICYQDSDAQIEELKSQGWMRRAFWEPNWDKGPWFCSNDCAYNSFNAKRAEELQRQTEFEKVVKETPIPKIVFIPIVFAAVLVVVLFLRGVFYAR